MIKKINIKNKESNHINTPISLHELQASIRRKLMTFDDLRRLWIILDVQSHNLAIFGIFWQRP